MREVILRTPSYLNLGVDLCIDAVYGWALGDGQGLGVEEWYKH
jgi:hypothetical protein